MTEGQLDLFSFAEELVEEDIELKNTTKQTTKLSPAKEPTKTKKSKNEKVTKSTTTSKKETNSKKKVEVETFDANEGIPLRPYCSVEIGDKVKVAKPIDNDIESKAYFDIYKSKKGTVIDIKQLSNPRSYLYQYNVWVQFEKELIGIFYDLELEII